jgi:hypothetical protein
MTRRDVHAALVAAALLGSPASAGAQQVLALTGDVAPVHDPTAIAHGRSYYVFATGGRPGQGVIPIRTSPDLRAWTAAGYVFTALPEWATREIPQARNAWAPDISFRDGKYWLYYSVSSFGSRNSAIGLATNHTLDASSPDYRWVDEGMVLRSRQERDDWNAIDPNVVVEDARNVWLSWGSFWGGIKMRRLDPSTGKPSSTDTATYSLASRPRVPPIDGADQRAARGVVVPARLVRPLLPRRRELVSRGGGSVARRDGTVCRQGGQADVRGRRLGGGRRDDADLARPRTPGGASRRRAGLSRLPRLLRRGTRPRGGAADLDDDVGGRMAEGRDAAVTDCAAPSIAGALPVCLHIG